MVDRVPIFRTSPVSKVLLPKPLEDRFDMSHLSFRGEAFAVMNFGVRAFSETSKCDLRVNTPTEA